MNVFEQAIENGEIRIGEIGKPMLTPKKWAAFLLCDEHEDDAYLFARQQIANDNTFRGCAVYEMQLALLKTEAFQRTMATQRRYRNADASLNANYFVNAIRCCASDMIKADKSLLPDDNKFATQPRPSAKRGDSPYGTFGWKGGAA